MGGSEVVWVVVFDVVDWLDMKVCCKKGIGDSLFRCVGWLYVMLLVVLLFLVVIVVVV